MGRKPRAACLALEVSVARYDMEFVPVILQLRRRKLGAFLVGLQVALTIAIVCNSLSVIHQRLEQIRRPSGLDEENIFTISNEFVGPAADRAARIQGDLAALRSLPGVLEVSATNAFPLRGYGSRAALKLTPEQRQASAYAADYHVDQHAATAWGLRLLAGRWFAADEIRDDAGGDSGGGSATSVVTQSLARALYPSGDALGKDVYLDSSNPTRIVGIVETAQTPWAANGLRESEWPSEHSVFLPKHEIRRSLVYLLHTRTGQRNAMMNAAPKVLFKLSRARIVDDVKNFAQTREEIYHAARGLSITLAILSILLLGVATCGIFGLTTFWVTQCRRQIGMRRALGARRGHILEYFHTENLLITGAGVMLGVALGVAANLWLAAEWQLKPLAVGYLLIGAFLVLALSQAAVIWPALRAASISPASAMRDT
jgi:putative ABC transport system permease protein